MTNLHDEPIEMLRQELADERKARLHAEAETKAKSELLATVSHEVRTPLSAIISMADLLLKAPLDKTNLHYASTLRGSAQGLLTVLNDVLDYSKLDSGKFALASAPFDLRAFMSEFSSGLQAQADEKGLGLFVEIDAACPDHLTGDVARIRQILHNLTNNALKFTNTGSIRLKVKAEKTASGEVLMRFEVHDTGVGISTKAKSRIFDPYAQASASVGVESGGTGLGLSIARQLAELMGGTLGCASVEGEGSVFWFTTKLKLAGEKGQAGDEAVADNVGPLKGHVLVVEDNEVNQMILGALLKQFDVTYDVASSGAEALNMVTKETYGAVLMDVMMPGMDGIETAKRIRALGSGFADLPIIALTANAMAKDREAYLAAGMNDYVSKPIKIEALYGALAHCFKDAASAKAGTHG